MTYTLPDFPQVTINSAHRYLEMAFPGEFAGSCCYGASIASGCGKDAGRFGVVVRTLFSVIAVVLMCALLGAIPQAWAEPPADACEVNLAAPQVQSAISSLPPGPHGWAWGLDPSARSGDFNPCATLSTAFGK
jgi:hypothetical protein